MTTTSVSVVRIFPIVLLALVASGCEAIGTIFQAGVWFGVIAVVIVLALVGFIAAKVRR
jgi:hypothetical protein